MLYSVNLIDNGVRNLSLESEWNYIKDRKSCNRQNSLYLHSFTDVIGIGNDPELEPDRELEWRSRSRLKRQENREAPSRKSSISSNSERYGTANELLEETSNDILEYSDHRKSPKVISGMSITYKLQQQVHVNFTGTADKAAFRTEPSVRSNNNVTNQTTDTHYNNNNNNKTYSNNNINRVDMVGTQQNLNHLQISTANSSAMRDSKTSYTNDLELSKPTSPSTQTEGCHHTFPVVPYINSSYGSADMNHERKILKSPEQVQDLTSYMRDHPKKMEIPSSTDGCVITRSIQGLFFFVFNKEQNCLPIYLHIQLQQILLRMIHQWQR